MLVDDEVVSKPFKFKENSSLLLRMRDIVSHSLQLIPLIRFYFLWGKS